MKHIFTFLAVAAAALALTSCEQDKPKNEPWNMDAKISLRPATGVKADENLQHLSAKEIVKQAGGIFWWYQGKEWRRGFADVQRDTLTPKLMMWGADIIHEGNYTPDFIEGADVIIVTVDFEQDKITDTIAYIPNFILQTAQPLIKVAFDAKDYATCYTLFDKAFTFIPITGEEWRELKAQGKN